MPGFNFTNKNGVSLAMAPFLALDTYQWDPDPRAISVTTLIKPLRMLVLIKRNQDLQKDVELTDMVPSAMGSALHARFEAAWKNHDLLRDVFINAGYTPHQIMNIRINPDPDLINDQRDIPIYTERRFYREVEGWKLSGQADLIINGRLHDLKTKAVWGFMKDSDRHDYIAQGSIYRWLSDGIIVEPILDVEFLFTDWNKQKSFSEGYPKQRVAARSYPLWSLGETEEYVREKLKQLDDYYDVRQEDLPLCKRNELWPEDDQWQWFSNPEAKRASKNCKDEAEAQHLAAEKGGVARLKLGKVRRCTYCSVVDICEQAKQMKEDGLWDG